MDLSSVLADPDLGFTGFTVQRTAYTRQSGASVPSVQTLPASGCIHPGTPEMLQLLSEEERHEDFIAVYTGFPLSLGENPGCHPEQSEGSGSHLCSDTYFTPDRILWNGNTWRVVRIRDWSVFGYYQALAVRMND